MPERTDVMRVAAVSALTFFVIICAAPIHADVSFKSGYHVDWWSSDSGDKGRQVYIPLIWEGAFDQFSFTVQTAQVFNFIDPDNPYNWLERESHHVDGLADTKVNLSYEILDRLPVDLLMALDVNLPTGTTGLKNADLVYITDSDLVSITRMGQGLNINPNITVLKEWGQFLGAVGLGYLWRGKYNASETIQDYDPGNVLNLTAEAVYILNPHWTGRLFYERTDYAADEWNDEEYYQPGEATIFGGGAGYTRAAWQMDARLTWVKRSKDRRQSGNELIAEDHNSYGDEWIAQVGGGYGLTDRTDLKADLRYLKVDANEYDRTDSRYASARTKISIGCEAVHRWSATLETGLRISIFTLTIEDNPDNWEEEDDYRGGSLSFWGVMQF